MHQNKFEERNINKSKLKTIHIILHMPKVTLKRNWGSDPRLSWVKFSYLVPYLLAYKIHKCISSAI